jgi:hypothetical protein
MSSVVFSDTLIEKLPSVALNVLTFSPFAIMLAPAIGCPDVASVTVPVIVIRPGKIIEGTAEISKARIKYFITVYFIC